MFDRIPHKVKIYEALGTLADGNRVEIVNENLIKVYSSSRKKFYNVYFDWDNMKAYSNDNVAFHLKRISYAILIFLFLKGILKYDKKLASQLKGIMWKDLHMDYNTAPKGEVPVYDYDEIIAKINEGLSNECRSYTNSLYEKIINLKINQFTSKELVQLNREIGLVIEPPKAY